MEDIKVTWKYSKLMNLKYQLYEFFCFCFDYAKCSDLFSFLFTMLINCSPLISATSSFTLSSGLKYNKKNSLQITSLFNFTYFHRWFYFIFFCFSNNVVNVCNKRARYIITNIITIFFDIGKINLIKQIPKELMKSIRLLISLSQLWVIKTLFIKKLWNFKN